MPNWRKKLKENLIGRRWKEVERSVGGVASVGLKKRESVVEGAALDVGSLEDGVDDACCLLHGCDKRC